MNTKTYPFPLPIRLLPYHQPNGVCGTKSILTGIAYLILLLGVFQPDMHATTNSLVPLSLDQAFTDPEELSGEAQYEVGTLYLKIADWSNVTVTVNSRRLPADLRSIFEQYKVKTVTQPFAALGTVKTKRIYKFEFAEGADAGQLIKDLELLKYVEYAERVPLKQFFATVPNDPSVSNPDESYHLELMRAYEAFDIQSGNGSVVAIVDFGTNTNHEDFRDNEGESTLSLVRGCDVGNNDDNPNPDDLMFSHGTIVAGLAGARTDNGIGIASIGWGNTLMPIKISDMNNDLVAGYQGIMKAAMSGARIINCSWGSYRYSHAEYTCVKEVVDIYGAIIIAAAGNENYSRPGYPAAYGENAREEAIDAGEEFDPNLVIAVASLNGENTRSSFSNYGTWVDIAAYGSNIYSTSSTANNAYEFASGTSLASPQVAGLVGLMMAHVEGANREDVISCLLSSANTDIYDTELANSLGAGRLDAYEALACMASSCDFPHIALTSSNLTICADGEVDIQAGPANSYIWSTGATTQDITVTAPGDYSVTVTLVDGCPANNTIRILPALTEATYEIIDSDFFTGLDPDDNIVCAGPQGSRYIINVFGGGTYSWDNGSTSPIAGRGGWGFTRPITITSSVTITDVGGCAGVTEELEIKVTTLPAPPIPTLYVEENSDVANDALLCSPDSEATISVTPALHNYEWDTGETIQAIDVNVVETTDYSVTISDENNCKSIGSTTVRVEEECDGCYPFEIDIDFGFDETLTDPCLSQARGIYLGPPNNGDITWEWTINEVPYTGQNIEFSRIPGQVRYVLNATNSCGEVATTFHTSNIVLQGVRDIAVTPNPAICGRYNFLADFNVVRPNFTLTWDFGDGTVINGASINESHFYEDDGTYTVVVTSERSCTNFEIEVVVDCPDCATSNITPVFSPQVECGDNVAFNFVDNDSPSQGIQAVLWDFGDGNTSTAFNPTHSYDDLGIYAVELVVVNNCGGTTSSRQTIQIGSCVPSFAAIPVGNDCGTFILTDINNCGNLSVDWDVDRDEIGSGNSLTYDFPSDGEYQVTATFFDADRCPDSESSESFIVTVDCQCPTPNIAFTFTDNGCGEFEYTAVNNDPSQTIVSWTWDFGFNEGEATGANSTHTYENSGLYTATLTAINDCGEENSFARLLNVDVDCEDCGTLTLGPDFVQDPVDASQFCVPFEYAIPEQTSSAISWVHLSLRVETGTAQSSATINSEDFLILPLNNNGFHLEYNTDPVTNLTGEICFSETVPDECLSIQFTWGIVQYVDGEECSIEMPRAMSQNCEIGGRITQVNCQEDFPDVLENTIISFNGSESPVTEDGFYTIEAEGLASYDIKVQEESLPVQINGFNVRTSDMVSVIGQILGTNPFTEGWEYVAADVDRNETVDVRDLTAMRGAIIGLTSQFSPAAPQSWVCPATIELSPTAAFPEVTFTHTATSDEPASLSNDFLAVELGNVFGNTCEEEGDNFTPVRFSLSDQALQAGQSILLPVGINGFSKKSVIEFAINYDNKLLRINTVKSGDLQMQKNDTYVDGEGQLRGIWFPANRSIANARQLDPNQFYLSVTAIKKIPKLSAAIKLSSEIGSNRIYSLKETSKSEVKSSEREAKKSGSGINWINTPVSHEKHSSQSDAAANGVGVYAERSRGTGANQGFVSLVSENPFTEALRFQLMPGVAQRVHLALYSSTGQQVVQQQFPATTSIVLDQLSGLPSGIYFYQLTDDTGRKANGKVVKR